MTLSDGGSRRGLSDGPLRLPLIDDLPGAPKMPASRSACRGEGICPVLRCRYNLAMHVTVSGTIVVGARGGLASGLSLPLSRTSTGRVRNGGDVTTQMAIAVVELADRLPSLCSLDYAEQGGMSLGAVARVFGVTREAVRKMIDGIVRKLGRDPAARRFLSGWDPGEGSGDPRP